MSATVRLAVRHSRIIPFAVTALSEEKMVMAETFGPAGPNQTTLAVTLRDHHVAYLDRLAEQIRRVTGAALPPPVIIRAMVEALVEAAAVNPSAVRTEDDLVDLFYRRFTQQEDRRHDRDRMRS